MKYECVIIGAGIAGITTAIYLKRSNISCLIIEKDIPGGQINKTSIVENYPGITSITGPDLAYQLYEQVKTLNIPYQYGNVEEIIDQGNEKIVKLKDLSISCKAVFIAVGRHPKTLNLPHEKELIGKGLSYCAICDGPLYRDKEVIVLGGGSSAFEEAIYLTNICKKVTLIHHNNTFKATPHLISKLKNKTNHSILINYETIDILMEKERFIGLKLRNKETNEELVLNASACFIFIGYAPSTSFLSSLNILNENGYIEVNNYKETKINNIYAVGDVIVKELYQLTTASSDGSIAASSYAQKRNQND